MGAARQRTGAVRGGSARMEAAYRSTQPYGRKRNHLTQIIIGKVDGAAFVQAIPRLNRKALSTKDLGGLRRP